MRLRPRYLSAVWALTMGTACQPTSIFLSPELPEDTRFAAYVMRSSAGTILYSTGLFEVRSSPISFELDVDLDSEAQVSVLAYSAEDLAPASPPSVDFLASSPVQIAEPGVAVLPRPTWQGSTSWSEWGETLDLRTDAAEGPGSEWTVPWLPVCSNDPCSSFPLSNPRALELEGDTSTLFVLVPLDDTSVLAMTFEGSLYRVTTTRAEKLGKWPASFQALDASRDPNGRIWVLGDRAIYRFEPPQDLVWVATSTARNSEDRIVAFGPDEIYVGSRSGIIEKFDGVRSTTLFDISNGQSLTDMGVATDNESILFTFSEANTLVRVSRDGGVTTIDDVLGPSAAAYFPGLGYVVGADPVVTGGRGIYAYDGQAFSLLEHSQDAGPFVGIWPFGRGMVAGGDLGAFNWYVPGEGTCGPRGIRRDNIFRIAALGSDVWVLGGQNEDASRKSTVTLVDVRNIEPPAPCRGYR